MRWLVTFVVVAALAVAFALAARYGEGYALFVYPPWRIEISLTLFLLAALALFAALCGLLRLASHTARLPQHVVAFRRRARASRAHEALRQARQAFLEGRYGRAEKLAGRAYGLDEAPGMAALLAARAAHAMRDPGRRGRWLARAVDAAGASRHARLATEAEAAVDERRFEEATGRPDTGARGLSFLRFGSGLYSVFDSANVSLECSLKFVWIRLPALFPQNAEGRTAWNFATTCWRGALPQVPVLLPSRAGG